MADRRTMRETGAKVVRRLGPLVRQTSIALARIDGDLKALTDLRVQRRITNRLAGIQLHDLDSTESSIRSKLLSESGVFTLADVASQWSNIKRMRGIGDVTLSRLQALLATAQQPTRRDFVIPNDPNDWAEEDYKFVAGLMRSDALNRHVEVTNSLRIASRHLESAQEMLRGLRWISRFSRGAYAKAQQIYDSLSSTPTVAAIESATESLETALAVIQDLDQMPNADIANRWRTSSASLQVAAEKLLPTMGFSSERRPEPELERIAPIGSTDLLSESFRNAIREFPLELDGFKIPLRAYQSFGAKFGLVAKGAILGDEMGLGKTLQALAIAHHLQRTLPTFHGLVVAPVSILENWRREILRSTSLAVSILHGDDRDETLTEWEQMGGLGLTSYQTLRRLNFNPETELNFMIVDEAHKVKNPEALQTQAARLLLDRSQVRILLTGTPLENRTEEFLNLVEIANPQLGAALHDRFGTGEKVHQSKTLEFRKAVSSGYLRRNQVDVLEELPELILTDEIINLSSEELALYRVALTTGNHAAVRQSVTIGLGSSSSKMEKFKDLIEEYTISQRKVIVYSTFLDVLDCICQIVGPSVLRIDGSVPPPQRQAIVDEFSSRDGHGVLAMQIDVGGTGLNIQAASVVILTEPQWKPSTEAQAIGRAHRMGQTERVTVHRLLADNTIDERIEELLDAKQTIFDAVVRPSQIAMEMPEATDTTTLQSLIAQEVSRLGTE